MTDLNTKIKEWKELLLKDRNKANNYYFENIFGEVKTSFKRKYNDIKKQNFKYLISLVGFSPQPIILFINAIKPQKVLFICSSDTEKFLDKIAEDTGLKISQIDKEKVDSSDVASVYQAIKKFSSDKDFQDIFIDVTGGKKSMVAGAMLAASILNIKPGYVDYEKYLPELRQPEPGSEYPNILKNPLTVFGDIEIKQAYRAFNQGNYSVAMEIALKLEKQVPDVWPARKLIDYINIYEPWEAFDFNKAYENCNKFLELYKDNTVKKHKEILESLIKNENNFNLNMPLNFYFTGLRYAARKRFDFSVLLMYRTIEQIFSYCLIKENINPSNPVYPVICTKEKYNEEAKSIFGNKYYEKDLPTKLALMDQGIILKIINHKITKAIELEKLKGIVSGRNESILAHGSKPMTENNFNQIRRMSAKLLSSILNIEQKENLTIQKNYFDFPALKI